MTDEEYRKREEEREEERIIAIRAQEMQMASDFVICRMRDAIRDGTFYGTHKSLSEKYHKLLDAVLLADAVYADNRTHALSELDAFVMSLIAKAAE